MLDCPGKDPRDVFCEINRKEFKKNEDERLAEHSCLRSPVGTAVPTGACLPVWPVAKGGLQLRVRHSPHRSLSPLGETGRDEAAPDRSVLAGADPGRGGDRSLRAGGAGRGIYDPFPVPLVDRLRPVLAASGVGETDGRRVPRHVPSGDVPPAEPHLRQPLPPVAVDLLAGRRGHDPVIRDDRVP